MWASSPLSAETPPRRALRRYESKTGLLPCQLEATAGSSQFFHPVYEVLQSLESGLNLVEGAGQLDEDAACQNPIYQIVPAEKILAFEIQSVMETEKGPDIRERSSGWKEVMSQIVLEYGDVQGLQYGVDPWISGRAIGLSFHPARRYEGLKRL